MNKRRKNSKNPSTSRVILHKMVSMVLILLIIFIFFAYTKELIRAKTINKDIKTMEKEIAIMEEKNQSIFNNIQYYKTLSFLEREAKLKMGKSKDGEKMLIVNNQDNIMLENGLGIENNNKEERIVFKPLLWYKYFFEL